MGILLELITTEMNYSRWKGDAKGVTKQSLCAEIVERMHAAGIHHRNHADVRAKIMSLQTTYYVPPIM